MVKTNKISGKKEKTSSVKKFPVYKLETERDIAMDFAQKAYQRFDRMLKAVVLFGSSAKDKSVPGSDIDIILIVDDASIRFDEKLILWYREELEKIIRENPYKKSLHINTVKLTTWWQDLFRGDPVVINIIRFGEAMIDFGGFFNPLKILLQEGKIKPTPESMYSIINRIPGHIIQSKVSEMSSIEGCYWAMTETAQAMLMAVNILPPSPEQIPLLLKQNFVDKNLLKMKYATDMRDLYEVHRSIIHGEVKDIDGKIVDMWQDKAEEFFKVALKIINGMI